MPAASLNVLPDAVISNNCEVVISSSFSRPSNTTAYSAGQLVANSTVAASVTPLTFANVVRSAGDCLRVERVRISKTTNSLTNASFKLHLFEVLPVPSVGDGAGFDSSGVLQLTTGALNHIGTFSVTMTISGTDGAIGWSASNADLPRTCCPVTGTTLYGLLEATAGYTPVANEVFAVAVEGYRT